MKPVMSGDSLSPAAVVAFAKVDVVVAVAVGVGMATTVAILMLEAHSNSSLLAGLAAILREKNIYLLVVKETHVS